MNASEALNGATESRLLRPEMQIGASLLVLSGRVGEVNFFCAPGGANKGYTTEFVCN